MTPETLIATFGYSALFAGTVLEGETFLIIAVMLAQNGHLDLSRVLAVAFAGAVAGDQCCFILGRTQGGRMLARRPRWRKKVRRVRRLLERRETAVVLGYRFFYGLRAVTPFLMGMNGFSPRRFMALSLTGTVLWLAVLGSAGIFFGNLALAAVADFHRAGKWILVGAVAAAAAFWLCRRLRKHR